MWKGAARIVPWRYIFALAGLLKMSRFRGKIRLIILLQIIWQIVCMLSGLGIVAVPFYLMPRLWWVLYGLVLDTIGLGLTLVYRRNVSSAVFSSLFDFAFVVSGLVVGLPIGLIVGSVVGLTLRYISPGLFRFIINHPGHYRYHSFRINTNTVVSFVFNVWLYLIALGVPILVLISIIRFLYDRRARLTGVDKKYPGIEEQGLAQGPQSFKYKELSTATKKFGSEQLLGSGGFGSVYKGSLVLKGDAEPTQIAVKRIAATSNQGAQEFLAEVKIIGQVQHRNLVRVLGWCCEKDELLLVYNYMPNGSVDQHLHRTTPTGEAVLTWARRLRIMNDVATALSYLHEEWEQRVIHRDVKSSNVMLDGDFNARLGDFGLARLSEHNQAPPSTLVLAGTFGYLAPELFRTLKPTEKTDVYSFGAMVLEVATGKQPLLCAKDRESLKVTFLVDWVWRLYERNALLDAVDCNLHSDYDPGEMAMFLKTGLLCCHPHPDKRPNMREVIHIWKGSSPFPTLPLSKSDLVFAESIYLLDVDTDVEDGRQTAVSFLTANDGREDTSRTGSSPGPMEAPYHSAVTIISEADGA